MAGNLLEPTRGDNNARAAGKGPLPAQYATAQLAVGFLLAEPRLEVEVRRPRQDAIGNRPLNRSPIICNQQIRPNSS